MHRFLVLGAVLAAALVHDSAAGAWSWPADGPVLRPFQLGPDGYAAGQYRGVDVGGDAGSPVRGPAAGTITFAGAVPIHGRGVTILTADGYAVTLFHLESVAVAKGDVVDEGAVVGTLGSSGDPEHGIPAVHLGIRRADQPEGYVDPLGLLPDRPAEPVTQPPPAATAPAPAAASATAQPPVAPPPVPPPVTAAPVTPPAAASAGGVSSGQAAPQPVAEPSTAVRETHATPGGSHEATAGHGVAQGITVTAPPSSMEASGSGSAGDSAGGEAAPGTGGIPMARAVARATPVAQARPERAPQADGSADASRPDVARTPGPSAGRGVLPAAHAGAADTASAPGLGTAEPLPSAGRDDAAARPGGARAAGLGELERPGTLARPLVVGGPGTGIGLAELIAVASLLALGAARVAVRLARRIDRDGAVLPDNPDLLRQLDAAHRPCLHDGRGGRVRASSTAARS